MTPGVMFRSVRPRNITPGVVALALGLASSSFAQEVPPQNVQRVYVFSTSGEEIQGHLLQLDGASLTMLVAGARRDLPLDSILRIETRGDSVRNGAIIGAAIGVVAGLLSAAEVGDDATVPLTVSSAIVWGLIGAGIDALIPGRTVIYNRPTARAATSGTSGPAVVFRVRF